MKISKILMTAVLSLTALFGVPQSLVTAEEPYKFVEAEVKTYEGIYMEVKGKPDDNYRKLGIVLDSSESFAGYDFFSVKFRNLSGKNIPFSITLEDENGRRLHTAKSGSKTDYNVHYYIPENGTAIETAKEYYACVNMTKDYTGGQLLIDISLLKRTSGETDSVKIVYIGLPAAYNVEEKIELLEYGLVKSADFTYNEKDGFSVPSEEIIESFEYSPLFDFKSIRSDEQFESLCNEYKILKCNNAYAVTKSFDDYISCGKTEKAQGLSLKGNCKNGVKFSIKSDGKFVEKDGKDKFGYIKIADVTESPVSATEALAIKMCSLYGSSAFRIIVVEKDGEAWQAGSSSGKFVFTDEKERISYFSTYYNCIWPSKKEGTLVIPYSAMNKLKSGSVDIEAADNDGKLTDVSKIYLAMDMAESSKDAKNRKIAVAYVADVSFSNKAVNKIADLTKYSFSDKSTDVADVNTASPELSKITTPCSKNADTNFNWVLGKPDIIELASKKEITDKRIGDVKVLEVFGVDNEGYDDTEKDIAIETFYSTYGENSYISYDEFSDGTTALKWQIGDYVNEFQNLSGGYCGLTIDPNSSSDNWGEWNGAKGITLRVKNAGRTEVSFNVAFQQTATGGTSSYRMNSVNASVYALDAVTGEEFSFRTGTVSSSQSSPVIYLPPNFDGWIRIDFSFFEKYSGNGPETPDFNNEVKALKITSYMLDNSEKEISFGLIGVYYENFTVDWIFGDNSKNIKNCLKGE